MRYLCYFTGGAWAVIIGLALIAFLGSVLAFATSFIGVGFANHSGGPVQITLRCFSDSSPKIHQFVLAPGQEDSFEIRCPD